MNKQSIAKAEQGYIKKPEWSECRRCKHFALDEVETFNEWARTPYVSEKNLRCTLGNFAVNKLATCRRFEKP